MGTPTYKDMNVGCAASSIVFSLAKSGFYGSSLKANISRRQGEKQWFERAKQLQSQLNWNDEVLVSELANFVKFYPTYRLIVVDLALETSQCTDWKGKDYVPEEEKNIIFLHYSTTDLHFAAISSIKEFVARKGSSYTWCFDCSSYYSLTSTLQNCYCDLPDQIPKKKKQSNCSHCGIDYAQGSKHICFHSQCHSCTLAFKNGSNNMLKHRCPVFMGISTKPSNFIGEPEANFDEILEEEDEYSKPQYCLWVYDLESCMVPVEGTRPSYVIDENGYFEMDGNTIKVVQRQKSKQVPNLVVYKNVFTGEMKHSKDVSEFLRHMMTSNDGRNIALAHNGSGYDTRLVFDALLSIVRKETELCPLLRGTRLMRLQVGKTVFGDTMLHLPGSLSDLAKDFLKVHPTTSRRVSFLTFSTEKNFEIILAQSQMINTTI